MEPLEFHFAKQVHVAFEQHAPEAVTQNASCNWVALDTTGATQYEFPMFKPDSHGTDDDRFNWTRPRRQKKKKKQECERWV